MAHQRIIKSEFFTDSDVAGLPPLHRLFFIGLWCQADRNGTISDRPKTLKARILPFDDCDPIEILDSLVATGFVVRFRVGPVSLLSIRTWARNQAIHGSERASTLPDVSQATEIVALPLINRALPVNSPVDNRQLPSLPVPVPVPVPVSYAGLFEKGLAPVPSEKKLEAPKPDVPLELFEFWRTTAKKNANARLTEGLRKKCVSALKIYSRQELEVAIRAFVADPWRRANPGAQGLGFLFRDVNRYLPDEEPQSERRLIANGEDPYA